MSFFNYLKNSSPYTSKDFRKKKNNTEATKPSNQSLNQGPLHKNKQ